MEEINQEKLHKRVVDTLEFIKQLYRINGGKEDPTTVFMWGNCGNLCSFLLKQFPEYSKSYGVFLDGELEHIITQIGERYYDIRGERKVI